jgi:hypothetical protein
MAITVVVLALCSAAAFGMHGAHDLRAVLL